MVAATTGAGYQYRFRHTTIRTGVLVFAELHQAQPLSTVRDVVLAPPPLRKQVTSPLDTIESVFLPPRMRPTASPRAVF